MDDDQKKTAKKHLTLIAVGVIGVLILLSMLSFFASPH